MCGALDTPPRFQPHEDVEPKGKLHSEKKSFRKKAAIEADRSLLTESREQIIAFANGSGVTTRRASDNSCTASTARGQVMRLMGSLKVWKEKVGDGGGSAGVSVL